MTEMKSATGLVRETDIVQEMQGAYLDYAMSVIVSRALPDVRDGLKPVHRRILYAMSHDLGLDHTKPHKKSARIVGEVLGKYHPHGDTAVYDAMVRMAQEFSLRYPLIDGQGNFGSIDGDGAAAMRYTEARLAEISQLMLNDLDKDTVEWHDNFDSSLREPDILPATLPNLLINGASGIAVGMATNIPPHNLGEVVDALVFMLDNYEQVDEITVDHLLEFIKGPDFPTGGIVYRYRDEKAGENVDVIAQGYSVGRSRLIVQAKAHFEEMSRGRSRIVITELPYQTNKVALMERIAALVRDGKIEGITDLRDESDRTGMRVVIELTRNADPKSILADLFKFTPLQQTFGMQMLALVDGEPRTLSLKRMLHLFIQHRQEIIRRRSEFDLARAKQREHILEGLLKALDILDEVIDTIRRSQNAESARNNLVRKFGFSEIQAQAILDMQLRRLAALERRRLQDEYKEVQKQIAYLEDLLAHPVKILGVIKDDLLALKEKYGDARRTQIVDRTKGTLTSTDLLPDQECWVTVGANGDLARYDVVKPTSATLRKVGKGSEIALLTANTRDYLYLFAQDGRCRRLAIHEIPASGKNLSEMTDLNRRDEVTAVLALPRIAPTDAAQGYLFLVTEQGMVKRITLADFLAVGTGDPTVMNVDAKDRLRWVLLTQGEQEVILVSAQGQSIRFGEEDVRSMGLAAGGVGGMKLKKGDKVVHAAIVDPAGELITMTSQGYAKRTPLDQYSGQGRNGSGIVTHKISSRTGPIAAALLIAGEAPPEDVIVLARRGAPDTVSLQEIPSLGRSVQGKQVITLTSNNEVTALRAVKPPHQLNLETPPPVVTLPPSPGPTNGSNGHNGSGGLGGPQRNGSGGSSGASSNGHVTNGRDTPSAAKRGGPAQEPQASHRKPRAAKTSTSAVTSTATATATRRKSQAAAQATAKTEPAPDDTAPSRKRTTTKRATTQAAEANHAAQEPSTGQDKAETAPKRTRRSSRGQAEPAEAAAQEKTPKKRAVKKETAKAETEKKGTVKEEAVTQKAAKKAAPSRHRGPRQVEAQATQPDTEAKPTRRKRSATQESAAKSVKPSAKAKEDAEAKSDGKQAAAKQKAQPKKGAKAQEQAQQPSLLPDESAQPSPRTTARRKQKIAAVTSVKQPKRKG